MNGDRSITQHGFRSSRRNRNLSIHPDDRVGERPEVPLKRFVSHFIISDGCLEISIPVHETLASKDEIVAKESKKRFTNGAGADIVESESRSLPIATRSQLPELTENPSLVGIFPLPDPLHQCFATDIVPRLSFLLPHAA